ncbi:hypothetical protein C0992_013312, partial [Termitomyces sp. T32_za158]
TLEEEENFSWEDDDEETGAFESSTTAAHGSSTPSHSTPNKTVDEQAIKPDLLPAASSSIAQDSSEEYDLVSGNVSPKEEHKTAAVQPGDSKDSSDGESDWE